jgi:hypothetical protein
MRTLTTDELVHHELHDRKRSGAVVVATWLILFVGFLVSVGLGVGVLRISLF